MTRKQFAIIAARIREEITNMARLREELTSKGLAGKPEKVRASLARGDSFTLRAVGSILHDFYVAAEKVFEVVARELDEKVPGGGDWHRRLLEQMTLAIPGVRPALLTKQTGQQLDEFRAFRHVFRNVYGFNLVPERLLGLLLRLPDVARAFEAEVTAFLAAMEPVFPEDENTLC
ncbi:MAG: ribonuclease toxin HepT-like protein [Desulfotomaculales bacterium]